MPLPPPPPPPYFHFFFRFVSKTGGFDFFSLWKLKHWDDLDIAAQCSQTTEIHRFLDDWLFLSGRVPVRGPRTNSRLPKRGDERKCWSGKARVPLGMAAFPFFDSDMRVGAVNCVMYACCQTRESFSWIGFWRGVVSGTQFILVDEWYFDTSFSRLNAEKKEKKACPVDENACRTPGGGKGGGGKVKPVRKRHGSENS